MRLVGAVLFVALTGSVAAAQDAKAPEPKPEAAKPRLPLRVVRMLPETHQVLLLDKERGTHVLAEVGGTVDGYQVVDIDDDAITLASASGQIVLTAPPRDHGDDRPVRRPEVRREAEPQPEDPYADPPVRSVEAPVAPTPAPAASPVGSPVVAPPALDAEPPTSTTIARAELHAALADFGQLAAAFRGGFVATGVKVDGVTEGSLFARVGLRAGDLVRAVDNLPLRSLDDAADLYARAGTARNITIQVVRGGKPLTLRVAIQ